MATMTATDSSTMNTVPSAKAFQTHASLKSADVGPGQMTKMAVDDGLNRSTVPSAKAFQTHASLKSADVGPGQMTKMAVDDGLNRSRSFTEHRGMSLRFSQHLFRRSFTNAGEYPPINAPSRRLRSARQPITMPRNHVSVARFYDWSEDLGDCFSVSKLYREIAGMPLDRPFKSQLPASNGSNTIIGSTGSNLPYVNAPGRMFIREKKTLTRGEREIIEGIYKNRGDISARDTLGRSEFQVKSHQEAWFVGKSPSESVTFNRVWLKGERIDGKSLVKLSGNRENDRSTVLTTSTGCKNEEGEYSSECIHHGSNMNGAPIVGSIDVYECAGCFVCQSQKAPRLQNQDGYWNVSPSAPPTTPDYTDKALKQPPPPTIFDKLLNMRPTIPPNSVLLAEKIRMGKTSDRQASSNPCSSGATSSGVVAKPGQLTTSERLVPIHSDNVKTKTQKPFSTHSEILVKLVHGSGNSCKTIFRNSEEYDDENNDNSDRDMKKIKVKVYLPTADLQTDDDQVEFALTKERPLSHKHYKLRRGQKV